MGCAVEEYAGRLNQGNDYPSMGEGQTRPMEEIYLLVSMVYDSHLPSGGIKLVGGKGRDRG